MEQEQLNWDSCARAQSSMKASTRWALRLACSRERQREDGDNSDDLAAREMLSHRRDACAQPKPLEQLVADESAHHAYLRAPAGGVGHEAGADRSPLVCCLAGSVFGPHMSVFSPRSRPSTKLCTTRLSSMIESVATCLASPAWESPPLRVQRDGSNVNVTLCQQRTVRRESRWPCSAPSTLEWVSRES
jgi:hypothetical protein